MFESKQKVDNLMNLVMQFRKVCNHPELFQRRPSRSPFNFSNIYNFYTGNLTVGFGQLKEIIYHNENPIYIQFPRLVYNDYMCESIYSF